MVIDCAPDLTDKDLRRLVNDVQIKRLADVDAPQSGRQPPPRPSHAERLDGDWPIDDHGATRSLLEDLLFDLDRDYGLPLPEINAVIEGVECDFSYRRTIIIEADGYAFHGTKIAFENDRDKWLAPRDAASGRAVVPPVTYHQRADRAGDSGGSAGEDEAAAGADRDQGEAHEREDERFGAGAGQGEGGRGAGDGARRDLGRVLVASPSPVAVRRPRRQSRPPCGTLG